MCDQSRKVALLIETARGYGRGVLRGAARYSRLCGPWRFHLTPGDFEQVAPKMRDWQGDGVIARVLDREMAEMILGMGLPTVFLDFPVDDLTPAGSPPPPFCVDLTSDSAGAAKMAAQSLLDKKLEHFAYAGYPFQSWSIRREKAFVEEIRRNGFEVQVYRPPTAFGRAQRWEKEEKALCEWLGSLPKPVGLMACNDQRGREVLDACETARIRVPEQVAVVGVDADELLCELSSPPLSSVALNAEKGGYLAAKALDDMMKGNAPESRHILVEPTGVIERRSTNVLLVEDEDVAAAMSMIHSQPLETLTVELVARQALTSRRQLEIKFRRLIGRTMLEELQNVRIERAKQLLRETDAPVERVAEMIGFSAAGYFHQTFRRHVGTTPAKYRRESRGE